MLDQTGNFSFSSWQSNAFNVTMRVSAGSRWPRMRPAAAGGLATPLRRTLVPASVKLHLAPDTSHKAASRDNILPSSERQRQQHAENNLITPGRSLAAFSRFPTVGPTIGWSARYILSRAGSVDCVTGRPITTSFGLAVHFAAITRRDVACLLLGVENVVAELLLLNGTVYVKTVLLQ